MYPSIDRVYSNELARSELGWRPIHDFSSALRRVRAGGSPLSELAHAVGVKGYHDRKFEDGPYPVDRPAPGMPRLKVLRKEEP